MSFDLTIPEDLQVPLGKKQVLVPLALIDKGALRTVSTEDHSGKPLPILGARDNSRIAAELLLAMLDTTPGGLKSGYDGQLLKLLEEVVAFRQENASKGDRALLEQRLSAAVRAKDMSDELSELVEEIAEGFLDHFLLVAVLSIDEVGKRVVLKFSYDRDLPTPSRWNRVGIIDFKLPDAGLTRSQHVEFEAPAGLVVQQLEVIETFGSRAVGSPFKDDPSEPRASAHVAFSPARLASGALVRAQVAPVGAGILSFSVLAVLAIVAFATVVAGEKYWGWQVLGSAFRVPTQAVSLILIGPALFLSWMARAPEHRTLATLLQPLRWMLGICTIILIAAGVGMAVPLQKWAWEFLWVGIPVTAGLNLLLLCVYVFNAPRRVWRVVQSARTLIREVARRSWRMVLSIWRFLSERMIRK